MRSLTRRGKASSRPAAGAAKVRLLRPDGTVRFVEYTATAAVVPGRHFGILRDLTERRSTQQLAAQRARIIEAFHRMQPGPSPELTADAVCAEITRHSEAPNAAIFVFEDDGTMTTLASSIAAGTPADLPRTITDGRAAQLRERAARGAWFETFRGSEDREVRAWLAGLGITTVALAPIEVGGEILGLLTVGDGTALLEEPDMLDAVVDYAALASSLLGASLIERRLRRADAAGVELIISTGAFHPVFQPILDLASGAVIGYEALTRFDNGEAPDQVFCSAAGCEQGIALEVATIKAALDAAQRLPGGMLIHVNVSPALILEHDTLARLLTCPGLEVVLEVTEHEQVADYGQLRAAVRGLGAQVRIGVDDAGAGFASLRHILELQPEVVKLDRALVAGIDRDPARQALVAGMVHFADGIGALLVGEGIETEGELETLKRLGARAGQGFLLGRALPAPETSSGDQPSIPMTYLVPNDVELSLQGVLESGENILGALTSLAGTLVLTDRRVVIVREGRGYRPLSGIRSWAISRTVDLRYGAPRGGMGRLVVGNGKEAISFFVKECDWDEALRIVTMARGIAHRDAASAGLS